MSNEKLESIINNEKEWRRHLLKEVEKTREELTAFKLETVIKEATLSTKIKTYVGLIGFVGGIISSSIISYLKH